MHNNGRLCTLAAQTCIRWGVRSLAYLFASCLTKKYLACLEINNHFLIKSFILATAFGLVVGMWLDEGRLRHGWVSFLFFFSLPIFLLLSQFLAIPLLHFFLSLKPNWTSNDDKVMDHDAHIFEWWLSMFNFCIFAYKLTDPIYPAGGFVCRNSCRVRSISVFDASYLFSPISVCSIFARDTSRCDK